MLSAISEREFKRFQSLIHGIAGIHLVPAKKALVCGRLARRVEARRLASFEAYYRLITDKREAAELQLAVDLLTTHETYFFREPRHFAYLTDYVLPQARTGEPWRVWSAAASSGEEAYSIAMVLADRLGLGGKWEVFASDISVGTLERARAGIYPATRIDGLPGEYFNRYCLRGVGARAGQLRIVPEIRNRVRFAQVNLAAPLPVMGEFDAIFLRNVLIYFDAETKRRVVERVIRPLRPGGWLFVGHSETLNGLTRTLRAEQPSIYRKQ